MICDFVITDPKLTFTQVYSTISRHSMKLAQPDNQNPIFPYRPELKYLSIFLPVIVSIPVITTVIFYYFLFPAWLTNSEEFQNIKNILVKYGNLSYNEGEKFSVSNISNFSVNNNSYTEEAVRLAQAELGGHFLLKLILPLVVVLGVFIWSSLSFHIPGVTKSIDWEERQIQKDFNHVHDKTLDFLSNYNGIIITVNGFIISILGGFLVTSGGVFNFYFFLGFEIIVFSLIASLLAYPSFISFSNLTRERKAQKTSKESRLLPRYFKIATFASAFLILGLAMLVSSLTV